MTRAGLLLAVALAGCGPEWRISWVSDPLVIELDPELPETTVTVHVDLDDPGPPGTARVVDWQLYLHGFVTHYLDTCQAPSCPGTLRFASGDPEVDATFDGVRVDAGMSTSWRVPLGPPLECRPRNACSFERDYTLTYEGVDLVEVELFAGSMLQATGRQRLQDGDLRVSAFVDGE